MMTWNRAPPSRARRSKSGGITMARLARPPSSTAHQLGVAREMVTILKYGARKRDSSSRLAALRDRSRTTIG